MSLKALCLILMHLTYPVQLLSLCDIFGHFRTWIFIVFNDTISHLHSLWADKLHWNLDWLTLTHCRCYACAIEKTEGEDCYWNYLNSTAQRICCPDNHQNWWYSEHKKIHCWKSQSIVMSDEIISFFTDLYIDKHTDMWMIRKSRFENRLWEVLSLFLFETILTCV